MPLRNRNLIEGPALLYLTTSRYLRSPFPDLPESLYKIEEVIFRTAREKNVILMGYVLMPTHIHLIAGSLEGGKGVSRFIHSIKGRIRETLQGKGKFWQDRFDDLLLKSEKQFRTKLNYIHYNPVRAGLVKKPEEWIFSSYRDWREGSSRRGITLDFDWMR
jgi:putative transposase